MNELEKRKKEHIDLALKSQVDVKRLNTLFHYEPMMGNHPHDNVLNLEFLGKNISAPLWISSMTGGTKEAKIINQRLAKVCHKYGLGMGLGSCRPLLQDEKYLEDFYLRDIIGDKLPLYANLGITQIEQCVQQNDYKKIEKIIQLLKVDGLIIHVNPLQEWAQPEGERINTPPIETIAEITRRIQTKFIVKEVGQGMGPKSLKYLMQLPLEAIEFAALGGTNFTQLELNRHSTSFSSKKHPKQELQYVGHTIPEMVNWVNEARESLGTKCLCTQFILSGGIRNILEGHGYLKIINGKAVIGQAANYLKFAQIGYEPLDQYVHEQIETLKMAESFLEVKRGE